MDELKNRNQTLPEESGDSVETAVKKLLYRPLTRRIFLGLIATGAGGAILAKNAARSSHINYPTALSENGSPNSEPETQQRESLEKRFETIAELNKYIVEKETTLGWSDQNPEDERFGEKFKKERFKLRPSNKERTAGFIVSDKLISDLEKAGENPLGILTRHIDYLNNLYKDANVDLTYSLTDIAIVPDEVIGSYTNIIHKHQEGVVLKNGEVFYPRYQDSTWVLSSDCNDAEFPNYAEKLIKRFADRIDKGLIHELIHHVGIHDLYRSQREFGPDNTAPITGYLPDHSGFMAAGDGRGNWANISPWEAFYLRKFIENGTFSPQHDADSVSEIMNPQSNKMEYYLNILASQYKFIIEDPEKNNLAPTFDRANVSTEQTDWQKHHFLWGANFERTEKQIILSNLQETVGQIQRENKGTPNLFVLKSVSTPGTWLPLDRHLLTLYHLAQPGEICQPIIIINPRMAEIKQTCSVGLDVITRTEEIPTEFMGNPVYGYSEVNNDLRAVWWVKPNLQDSSAANNAAKIEDILKALAEPGKRQP